MKSRLLIVGIILAGCGGGGGSSSASPPPADPPLVFSKHVGPVWEGTYVAGDPSVIRFGGVYRMYYTSVDTIGGSEHIMLAGAVSADGIAWTKAVPAAGESVALDGNSAGWDRFLETAEVVADGGGLRMWYCGYPAETETTGKTVANGEIGCATSADGAAFTRTGANPVLGRGGSGDLDYNALFSPTVVFHDGLWHMLYTGWAIDDAPATPYIGLLGATSPDGITWTKRPGHVLSGPDLGLAWASVVKEADLVRAPDGSYYLFFTGDDVIGMARSAHPFGPWSVHPTPLLAADQAWEGEGVIAPSVIIEGGRIRLWYMGFQAGFGDFAIGYAEAPYPFAWPDSG